MIVFFYFSLTVKAAPHECVIRTSQPKIHMWRFAGVPMMAVKAENEAWLNSKVTVSSYAITLVWTQNTLFSP